MWCIYRKTIHKQVRKCFIDKVLFLSLFSKFIHRKWIEVRNTSFKDFEIFINSYDCVAKPVLGEQGKGIFIISKETVGDVYNLWCFCKDNNYFLEERITGCWEIEEFHPKSLNTIRIVTMSGNGDCIIIGALLRMGVNDSIIDNSHSGGIFVPIDVNSGITIFDGVDINGNIFKTHPNTGKIIKGFHIPHWQDCLNMCIEATKVVPNIRFAGWDLCVLPNGGVELIEGNSAPDVDGGLQVPLKEGIKKKIKSAGEVLFGFNPLSLISIWSRSYKDS